MTRISPFNPVVIVSKKSMNGRTFGNTWHFHVPSVSDAEARVAYAVQFISPVLNAFERGIHSDLVTLVDHYIGDTRENRPPTIPVDSFYERVGYGNVGYGLTGAVLNNMAPLNVALLLKLRVSSERPGFKFVKGILGEGDIAPGGRSGVILAGGATLAGFTTMLNTALTASGLGVHFQGGTGVGDWEVATAHYTVDDPTNTRYVDHMSAVAGMSFAGATSRQVDRRRTQRTPKDEV